MGPIVCRFCRKITVYKPPPASSMVASVFCGCTSVKVDLADLSVRPIATDLRARLDILFGPQVGDLIAEVSASAKGPVTLERPTPIELHPDLLALASDLLARAGGEFSNHSCNDWRMQHVMAPEARQQLADLSNQQSGDDDEKDVAETFERDAIVTDWCLMHALSEGLLAMSGRTR